MCSSFSRSFVVLATASMSVTIAAQIKSDVRKGPHGLSGYTVLLPIPNQGYLPTKLIVSRKGKVVRKFAGDPFVWNWMFVDDGRKVAIEAGRLHFVMNCYLIDIRTGNEKTNRIASPDLGRTPRSG